MANSRFFREVPHMRRCWLCDFSWILYTNSDLPYDRFLGTGLTSFTLSMLWQRRCRVCDHVTFSLLPHELVPFRQLSLNFMVRAIWFKVSRHLSYTKALDVIEAELNSLGDIANFINISTMMSWQRMILRALALFISADINMVSKSQYEQLKNTASVKLFLALLINHQSQISNHPIRGPDEFTWNYYQQSGGSNKNAAFLFGRASQHRN